MRLLLVDDEFFVRERIVRQLDWQGLGIDDIRQASNGVEAIKMLRDYSPDILLTDVRMPNMDGLQLAEEIIRLKPDCKLIFISGYSDAPYLRTAIRLRAVSYVEKPIDMVELTDSIRNAAENVRREHFIENNLQKFNKKNRIAQIISAAKRLTQQETLNDALESVSHLFDVLDYTYFFTVAARLIGHEDSNITDEELVALICDVFTGDCRAVSFRKADRIIIHVFCKTTNFKRREKLEYYLRNLTSQLAGLNLKSVYAIGRADTSPKIFHDSYETAVQALSQCYYKTPGCICYYRTHDLNSFDFEKIALSDFSHALIKDSAQHVVNIINNLTTAIKAYDSTPPNHAIRFYYTIIVMILRAAEQSNTVIFDEFEDEYAIWDHIHSLPFIDDLHSFVILAANRYFNAIKSATGNAVVNRIIAYLRQNYHNPDLSVTIIADNLRLSPTYICHLFKNTVGETLGNFLTRLRIGKARELIETGEYRVKDVARMVGYRNGNYFSYVYKKEMGESPSGLKT
ncbi:MAG: response regulator [Clostridiales bacterium]|nr:response regulator [Clostridiales bacterium]